MFYDHYDTPRVTTDAITGVRPGTHVDLGLTKSVVIISLQCKAKIDEFSQSIYDTKYDSRLHTCMSIPYRQLKVGFYFHHKKVRRCW